jgi:uncharacterized protein (DUF1697 family)
MKTFIALFRGINVGGKNMLPMKQLTYLLETIGCKNVKTYIQSGNVVFCIKSNDVDDLSKKITSKILKECGFEPKVLILDSKSFHEAIKNNPFTTDSGKALHFFFLFSIPENVDFTQLDKLKSESEEYRIIDSVFYLFAPDGIGRSKLAAKVEQLLNVTLTARNWNTVSKISNMI